jgi:hypothetical protein
MKVDVSGAARSVGCAMSFVAKACPSTDAAHGRADFNFQRCAQSGFVVVAAPPSFRRTPRRPRHAQFQPAPPRPRHGPTAPGDVCNKRHGLTHWGQHSAADILWQRKSGVVQKVYPIESDFSTHLMI